MENNSINEIVETALSNLQKVAEVNTIVGKPLVTVDGTTIVPVSQITFAFMAGGGEYGNKNSKNAFARAGLDSNFAGGSGGGASLVPVGFLIVDRDGVRMMETTGGGVLDKIVDAARSFVGN